MRPGAGSEPQPGTPGLSADAEGVGPDRAGAGSALGVDQPHLFTLREPAVRQPRMYPHSQAILINLLTCFEIERGMLLPDGRLEVAMRAGA